MLAATAIAANFFMMCGLPKMPFRGGETFPSRERRDLAVPRESSTKIIEMVGVGGNLSFDRNNQGNSLSRSRWESPERGSNCEVLLSKPLHPASAPSSTGTDCPSDCQGRAHSLTGAQISRPHAAAQPLSEHIHGRPI